MYVRPSNLGALSGEWSPNYSQGWQQSIADARWAEIGQHPPAPLVPASLIGWKPFTTRGRRMFKNVTTGKLRGVSAEENDFLNYFGKVAVDPYRDQSLASKVAGGVLQVASVAIPAFGYFQGATSAVNAAEDMGKAGGDAALATRVLTPAVDAFVAKENDAAKALEVSKQLAFDAQLKALQANSLPVASFVPSTTASAAQIQYPVASPVAKKYFGLTQNELIASALALLGIVFVVRSRA